MSNEIDPERLHSFFDNELSPADRADVERHLQDSRSSRAELAWLKLTAQAIRAEEIPVPIERLGEVRAQLLSRYEAMLSVQQPNADDLKHRVWTNSPVAYEPRSAGKGEAWSGLSHRNDLGREQAGEQAARLARELNVEIPATLKLADRKAGKSERED